MIQSFRCKDTQKRDEGGRVARTCAIDTQARWKLYQLHLLRDVLELRADYAATFQALRPALLFQPDAGMIDGLLASCLRVPPEAAAALMESSYAEDLRGHLSAVKPPLLLRHSQHDQIGAPQWIEYATARLPDYRTVWLETCGHDPMLEEPERVSQALAEFAGE